MRALPGSWWRYIPGTRTITYPPLFLQTWPGDRVVGQARLEACHHVGVERVRDVVDEYADQLRAADHDSFGALQLDALAAQGAMEASQVADW